MLLDQRGVISRIAGSGVCGYDGDGGLALEAPLNQPYDVARDPTANLYIADFGNHRIRKVDSQGRISTVAGTGAAGYSGDGRPAVEAQLNGPYGVFVDAEDNVLIADSLNHVIRKIDADGDITTIAGTGRQGYSGDDGPAIAAAFDTPNALFMDTLGRACMSGMNIIIVFGLLIAAGPFPRSPAPASLVNQLRTLSGIEHH